MRRTVPCDDLSYFVDTKIGPFTHGRIRDVRRTAEPVPTAVRS
jgi:hypothetical protein